MENDNANSGTNNNTNTIERQELYCHNCGRYVQFDIDTSLNGCHVIVCPNCKHEHFRVVIDGIITEYRWGSTNNSPAAYYTVNSATITTTQNSTFTMYSNTSYNGGDVFLYMAWMNTNVVV